MPRRAFSRIAARPHLFEGSSLSVLQKGKLHLLIIDHFIDDLKLTVEQQEVAVIIRNGRKGRCLENILSVR